LFSGRFQLTLDTEGAYCIDRDGVHFRHILNHLRSPGRYTRGSDLTEGQKDELAVELEFYGLLDQMMPHHASERVGQALLRRACVAGTKAELQTAVAQARALVLELGSTMPFLNDKFQGMRFVIIDRMVNGFPVWAAEGGELFMYRIKAEGWMAIGDADECAEGVSLGSMINRKSIAGAALTPTDSPSDYWLSGPEATLEAQYSSATRFATRFVHAAAICITVEHGLDSGDPAMAAALQQLAALA
jgi:hypothetical protein